MSASAQVLRAVRSWWRSSLQARVITTTMAIGLAVAGLVGTLVFQQVADGLVRQAVDAATADSAQQVRRAQELFSAVDQRDNTSLNAAAQDIVGEIAPSDGAVRRALLAPSLGTDREALITPLASSDIGVSDIPEQIRTALEADPGNQQLMVTEVDLAAAGPEPSVVVGSRVDIPRAGPHDLFLIYPMTREQSTLGLIGQWFLVAGAVLLALVAGVAWVATRMVVDPVRRVSAASRQLAAGDLDQRLPVRGTDELDRLALSFNTMADSLRTQIRQLETLSRLQQRFVSDVSHELRTPLTTMRMAAEVLHASRDDFTAPVARSTELLKEEVDRFESLLTELLEVSRYDAGAAALEMAPTDLAALVEEVVQGLAQLVAGSGSTVSLLTPDGRPVLADVDGRRVSRIVRNLVGNAVKYGEGGPIEITVAAGGDTAQVLVRDHGIGLSQEQVERVFDRFWRADPARTRSSGIGLGLAIAQDDTGLHGGWLDVAGAPGEGALFRLTLPRRAGGTVPQPAPLQLPAGPPPAGPPPAGPLRAATGAARQDAFREESR